MAGPRSLRRRFRDDSIIATLMEVPTWLFGTFMVCAVLFVVGVSAGIDVYRGTREAWLTAVIPVVLVGFFGGLFWLAVRERLLRQRRLAQASSAHRLWLLMPDEMADAAAELFRLQDYGVTENKRPDLADGGVDFEVARHGKTWLVQVKHWRQEVSVKEARELWGIVASEGAAGGILIGTSGFSKAAREFALGKDLALIDGPEFIRLRARLPHLALPAVANADPMVSEGFVAHLTAVHRPACPKCRKQMVLVTRLEDVAIVRQFWGCKDYPECDGSRRFAFPYSTPEKSQPALSQVKGTS